MDIILDSVDRESNSAQLIGNAGGSDVAVVADGFSSATGNEIPWTPQNIWRNAGDEGRLLDDQGGVVAESNADGTPKQ